MPQYSLPEIFPGLIQRSLITKKKPFLLQLKLVELTLNTPCNVQHTTNNNSLKKVPIILKKFLLQLGTHNSQSNASIIYLCLLVTNWSQPLCDSTYHNYLINKCPKCGRQKRKGLRLSPDIFSCVVIGKG